MADQYNSAYTGAQIDAAVGAVGGKLDKTGDASSTIAKFTAATSRANIKTGEKLSVIFGKLAKWFADLKTVAFTGKYSDLSGTPTVPSASTTTPVAASGEGAVGSESTYARGDHSHPLPEVTEVELVDIITKAAFTLTVAGWSSSTKKQTVSVEGVSATEADQLITVVPAIASQTTYYGAKIYCSGQAANSLTFTCDSVPTAAITGWAIIQPI